VGKCLNEELGKNASVGVKKNIVGLGMTLMNNLCES
jgi:hypothetical protein